MRQGQGTRWDLDAVLSAACACGLVVVSWLLAREEPHRAARSDGVKVGVVSHAQEPIRRRPPKTLGWDALGLGDAAFTRDTIFVPPGQSAVITLDDGTELALEENSLLVLERGGTDSGPKLLLERGAVTSTARTHGVALSAGGTDAAVAPGSVVRFDAGEHLDVLGGKVAIGGAQIDEGQSGSRARGFVAQKATPLSPVPGARFYVSPGRPEIVKLRYRTSTKARVQVAATADFAAPSFEREATGDTVDYSADGQGTRYWRLIDASGEALSPTTYFVVADDTPPLLLVPRQLENVVARNKNDLLFFSWTECDGAKGYRLEIARDAAFTDIALLKKTTTARAAVSDLDEGEYHWRVTAEREQLERSTSPSSAPRSFRLTRKPLPHAPELFDPTVELKGK